MSNCLLADIGGTRARFALLAGSRIGPVESMATGEYASAGDAIRHFLNRQHNAGGVDGAVIAAAGPVAAPPGPDEGAGIWPRNSSRNSLRSDLADRE